MKDVGAYESYDLHCTDELDRALYVEVKGTTGSLSDVLLTANEVKIALNQFPDTALFVVHEIELNRSADPPDAGGGGLFECRPWLPDPELLEPTVYRYRIAPAS